MAATVVHGRPGTPMPPWRAMLSDADVRWIVEQLARGFPQEHRAAR
jgi:cytochrome c55X